METLKHLLQEKVLDIPVWWHLLTLVLLPIVNELVLRSKSTLAESILQGVLQLIYKASPYKPAVLERAAFSPGVRAELKKDGGSPPVALLIPFVCLALSSCYCWEPAHATEAKCVAARGVVNCTVDAGSDAVEQALPVFVSFIEQAGTRPDWGKLLGVLTDAGVKDVLCVVGTLVDQFFTKARGVSSIGPAQVSLLHQTWVDYAHARLGKPLKLKNGNLQ